MSPPMERIQSLEAIEKDIILCLKSAGKCVILYTYNLWLSEKLKSKRLYNNFISTGDAFQELSKDKSNIKNAENHTNHFMKTLSQVETKLSEQINYLTQVSTGE